MTVKELMDKLTGLPADAKVIVTNVLNLPFTDAPIQEVEFDKGFIGIVWIRIKR